MEPNRWLAAMTMRALDILSCAQAQAGLRRQATLVARWPASCKWILSVRVGSGTERTRGASWYQTRAWGARQVYPATAESRDWVCHFSAGWAILIRLHRGPA